MKRVWMTLAMIASLVVLAVPAGAQDYRGRVQGVIADSSGAALPGVTVTMTNTATNVTATRVSDTQGRYVFDFVDPGGYTIIGELSGFKKADQRNVRVPQRGDVTVSLTLDVGGIEETVIVLAAPSTVKFNSQQLRFHHRASTG